MAHKKHKKHKRKQRIFLSILLTLVMMVLIAVVCGGLWVLSLRHELPDITVEDLQNEQTSFVFAENGTMIAELYGGENRINVDLADMPQQLIDCLISTEDMRFYSHHGVDFRSALRALVIDAVDSIRNRSVTFSQGASTLTMQLVRNVIDEREKTIVRKIKEAMLALEFEKSYDKDEILYYYMNEIYIGPRVYGMQAGAQYYFGKDVGELTLSECAMLVGLIRNPGYYSPYGNPDGALRVRNTVLQQLADTYPDYYEKAMQAMQDELVLYEDTDDEEMAYNNPWYVDAVVAEGIEIMESMGYSSTYLYTGGFNIYTAMDQDIQTIMETEYANPDNFPDSNTGDIVESGMIIVDPHNGEIKALCGGREYTTRRGFNRATDLVRSPGSTIKPVVVYGPAVELGYGTGYVLNDGPVSYGSWSPHDDDGGYLGLITMRRAVQRSRNIYAVEMLAEIGAFTGYQYGLKMGLSLVDQDANSLAMALGGLTYGVSPEEMCGAFATFASGGIYTEPHCITKITTAKGDVVYEADPVQREVFSAQTAYMVTSMLTSVVTGGTGTNAAISGWQVAGKTGTNGLPSGREDPDYAGRSGVKDAWFCGYTTELACAVWMGYDDKKDADGKLQYMTTVYGSNYPARVWRKVMSQALEKYEPSSFSNPGGVVSITVDSKSGKLPSELTPDEFKVSELYNDNAVPTEVSDVWKVVQICQDTGALASPYCPNVESKVMLTYPEGKPPSERVGDYSLYMPSTTCSVHSTYQTGLTPCYICTAEEHQGRLVLANLAGHGGEGGCPNEDVQLRYYAPGSVPTAHCDLAGHQVTKQGDLSGYTDNDDEHNGGSQVGVITDWPTTGGAPATPGDLSAVKEAGAISLSWNGSTAGTVSYIVERTASDGSASQRYRVYGLDYTDTDLTEDVTYTYRVYAYDSASKQTSGWSGYVSVNY